MLATSVFTQKILNNNQGTGIVSFREVGAVKNKQKMCEIKKVTILRTTMVLMKNLRGAMKRMAAMFERTPSVAATGRDSMLYTGSLMMTIRGR